MAQLRYQLQTLPVPSVQTKAITGALDQALDRWQQDACQFNGFVIVGRPVVPIEAMVYQALAQTPFPIQPRS